MAPIPKRRRASAVTSSRLGSSGTSATIAWTDTRASPTWPRSSSSRSSSWIGRFHQSACSRTRARVRLPTPPMVIGIGRVGVGQLLGAVEREVLAVVVDDLAGPQASQDLQGLGQPAHPHGGLRGADPEDLELDGHRAPPDPELEPAVRGVVERRRLPGEHRRVAEASRRGRGGRP